MKYDLDMIVFALAGYLSGSVLYAQLFVRLFTSDADLAARSVSYIKRFTCMILPLAIQYPLVDESIALGQVHRALFCWLFRKGVFLAGLILLPMYLGAEATFFSEPIADLAAAVMTSILFLRAYPRALRTCAAYRRHSQAGGAS